MVREKWTFNGHDTNKYFAHSFTALQGYCFVEFSSSQAAREACLVLQDYHLDKNHSFSANLFTDLNRYSAPPKDNWQAPESRSFKDLGDPCWWLQNPKCQDQFALYYDSTGSRNELIPTVSIYWNSGVEDPALVNDHACKEHWTESVIVWSPLGTYATTFHQKGIALWMGAQFAQFQRYSHDHVSMIDFSPQETFLVTYAPLNQPWKDTDCVRIWNVCTGETERTFSPASMAALNTGKAIRWPTMTVWPYFQWSHDECYFACTKPGGGGISVYESGTFSLVDNKSVSLERMKEFKWAPVGRHIAYVVEEQGDSKPAEIAVMKFPEKTVRAIRVFRMAEATLYWQKSGDRLAVRTDRYQKKKMENKVVKYSGLSYHLEVFFLKVRDTPVESLQLSEEVVAFGWEPMGDKFCVLLGSAMKPTPVLYRATNDGTVSLLCRVDVGSSTSLDTISWAPSGGWLTVAGLKTTGNLLFIDGNAVESAKLSENEHPGANEMHWDPTGRFLVTCATIFGSRSTDFGYRMFTFQGRELARKNVERLAQFLWRPRPPLNMPEITVREVKRNMKLLSQKFEEEDKRDQGRASKEVIDKRIKLMKEFDKWRHFSIDQWQEEKIVRLELRDNIDTDHLNFDHLEEETIEVVFLF